MSTMLIILFVLSLISNIYLFFKCAALDYLYNYLKKVLTNTKTNILNLKNCLKKVITLPELSQALDDYFDAILEQVNDFAEK